MTRTRTQYTLKEKIDAAKRTIDARRLRIPMKEVSKLTGINTINLNRWAALLEKGELKHTERKKRGPNVRQGVATSNELTLQLKILNENLKQALIRIDAFYPLIERLANGGR